MMGAIETPEERRLREEQEARQQQGGQSMPNVNPQQIQQFMGGGEAAAPAATPAAPAVGGAAPAAAAAPTAAAAPGAAGGAGSAAPAAAAAAASPWVAIGAAIVGNELLASKSGRRADGLGEKAADLATGKVLARDAEALGDKIGGKGGKVVETLGNMGNPKGFIDEVGGLFS